MSSAAKKIHPESEEEPHTEFAGFVSDDATRETVTGLADKHWPGAPVQSGGAAAAAAYLAGAEAARRILVDLSDSVNPRADLADLKQLCGANVAIVALGTEDNVEIYRDLRQLGAADYLVKPVNAEALEEALLTSAQEPVAETPEEAVGNVGIVIGARGGVGASTIAVNCAWVMAEEMKMNVALIDLDLQFGTVALDLDTAPGRGLSEALQNPTRIDGLFISSAIAKLGERLSILASEEAIDKNVLPENGALEKLFAEVRGDFDWLWIDMPRSTLLGNADAMAAASKILIVSDLSLAGMRDTLRIANFCRMSAPNAQLIFAISRPGEHRHGLPTNEFERGIEGKIDYTFPEDSATAAAAAAAGKPLTEAARDSKLAGTIRGLCRDLLGTAEEPKKPSLVRRLMGGGEE